MRTRRLTPLARRSRAGRGALFAASCAGLLAAALCVACSAPPLAAGTAREAVLRSWGQPTSQYDLGQGAQRLEYATGPYGKSTRMVDLDAQGRVVQVREVLTESALMAVQGILPGMPAADVLRTLGRPGERRQGGWQGGEVWSWRYLTNDCLWFQVSLGDDRRARDGGFYVDPACDSRDSL
jgi:hypothetical protein